MIQPRTGTIAAGGRSLNQPGGANRGGPPHGVTGRAGGRGPTGKAPDAPGGRAKAALAGRPGESAAVAEGVL